MPYNPNEISPLASQEERRLLARRGVYQPSGQTINPETGEREWSAGGWRNPARIAGTVPESAGAVGPNYNERLEMLDELNRFKTFRGFDTERWQAQQPTEQGLQQVGREGLMVPQFPQQPRSEFIGRTITEPERIGSTIAQENRSIMESMAREARGERIDVLQARQKAEQQALQGQPPIQPARKEHPFTPALSLFKTMPEEPETLRITNPEAYESQVKSFMGQLTQSGEAPKTPEGFEQMLQSLSGSKVSGNMGALREAGERYLQQARPKLYQQLVVSNFEGTANDVSKVSFFDAAYPDLAQGMGNDEKLAYMASNPDIEKRWRNDFAYPKYRFDVKSGNIEETVLPTIETVKNRRTMQQVATPTEFFEKGGNLTAESLRPFNLPAKTVDGLLNAQQVRSFHNVMDLAEAADVPAPTIGALKINNNVREGATARVSELAVGGLPPEEAIKQIIQEAKDEGKLDVNDTEKYSEYGASAAMAVKDVYTAIGDQSIRDAQRTMQVANIRGGAELEKRTPLIMAQSATPEYIQSLLDSKVGELQDNISRASIGARMGGSMGQRGKANLLSLRQQLGIPTELPNNLSVESILSDYILPSMSREYANDPEMKAFLDEQIVSLKFDPSGVNPAVWTLGQSVAGQWAKGAKALSQQVEQRKQNIVERIGLENPNQSKMTTADLVAIKTWNPDTNKEDTQYIGVDRAMQSIASPSQISQMMVGLDNQGKKQFMTNYGFQPGVANVINADNEARLYSESLVRSGTRLQAMEQAYNPSNKTRYFDLMVDSKGQKQASIPAENWMAGYRLMFDPDADLVATQRTQLQTMLQESFTTFANNSASSRAPLPTLYSDINRPIDFEEQRFQAVNPSINVNATFMSPEIVGGAVNAIANAAGMEKFKPQMENLSLALQRNAGQFKPATLDIIRTGTTRDRITSESVGPIHDYIYEIEGGKKTVGKERVAALDEILDSDAGTNEKLDIARSLRDLGKKTDNKNILFKAYAIVMDDAREGQEYVGKTVIDEALRGTSVAITETVNSIASEMMVDFKSAEDMANYFDNRYTRLNLKNAEAVADYAADLDFALDAIGKEVKMFNTNMTDVQDKASKLGSNVIDGLLQKKNYADKLKEMDGLQQAYINLARQRNSLPYLTPMGIARTPAGQIWDYATTPIQRAYGAYLGLTKAGARRIKETAVGLAKGVTEQIKGE